MKSLRSRMNGCYLIILLIILFLSGLAMVNGIQTKSLLMDEAFFARNLSYFPNGLFIGSAPSAPLFYFASYGMISLFGRSEWVYRFIPLLSSIFGLILLIVLFWQLFPKMIAFISGILAATSVPLIHFTGYAHPYATDFFFTVLLMYLTIRFINGPSLRLWLLWLLVAFLGIGSSYPALFTVTTCGAVIFFNDVIKQNKSEIHRKLIGFGFLAVYILFLIVFVYMKQSKIVGSFFISNHPNWYPRNVLPWHVLKWAFKSTNDLMSQFFFNYMGGLIGIFLIILGIAQSVEKKKYTILLCSLIPIVMAMAAAVFHQWSYSSVRTMLFSIPLFLLLIASGLEYIWNTAKTQSMKFIIQLSFILLLIPQSYTLTKGFKKVEDSYEAVKTLAKTVKPEIEKEDLFLVYYSGEVHFRFYFPEYVGRACFQPWSHRENPDSLKYFVRENTEHLTSRFWLIFSKVHGQEDEVMISEAEKVAPMKTSFLFPGAKAYLFEGVLNNQNLLKDKDE